MVVMVRLDGLNIVCPRGKWYVYVRDTGKPLLKGFVGSKDDLLKHLAKPEMIAAFNATRKRDLKHSYPEDTLGGLIQWFENDCPEFTRLAESTKKDYRAAFVYLQPEWDSHLSTITQPLLYEVRDKASKDKWPRFADQMISALSSMFTRAVRRGKMPMNPALGVVDAHKADPNANREWQPTEFPAAIAGAPMEIKIPLMLARHAGFRGQTIAKLGWKSYQPDPNFTKCFRHVARKNEERSWIPVMPELQTFLDGLDRTSVSIAVRDDGTPWADEKQMQTAVSHYLRACPGVDPGATLHGLRVSYAADLKRGGADNEGVAAALGDKSEAMGKHYTRHVDSEVNVVRAFKGKTQK